MVFPGAKVRGPSAPGKRQQQTPAPSDAPVHAQKGRGDQGQAEVWSLTQGPTLVDVRTRNSQALS